MAGSRSVGSRRSSSASRRSRWTRPDLSTAERIVRGSPCPSRANSSARARTRATSSRRASSASRSPATAVAPAARALNALGGTAPHRCCRRAITRAASVVGSASSGSSTRPRGSRSETAPPSTSRATSGAAGPVDAEIHASTASVSASPARRRRSPMRAVPVRFVDQSRTPRRSSGPSGTSSQRRATAPKAWSRLSSPAGAGGHPSGGVASSSPAAMSLWPGPPARWVSIPVAANRCWTACHASGDRNRCPTRWANSPAPRSSSLRSVTSTSQPSAGRSASAARAARADTHGTTATVCPSCWNVWGSAPWAVDRNPRTPWS